MPHWVPSSLGGFCAGMPTYVTGRSLARRMTGWRSRRPSGSTSAVRAAAGHRVDGCLRSLSTLSVASSCLPSCRYRPNACRTRSPRSSARASARRSSASRSCALMSGCHLCALPSTLSTPPRCRRSPHSLLLAGSLAAACLLLTLVLFGGAMSRPVVLGAGRTRMALAMVPFAGRAWPRHGPFRCRSHTMACGVGR